jgi:hypothetical protein
MLPVCAQLIEKVINAGLDPTGYPCRMFSRMAFAIVATLWVCIVINYYFGIVKQMYEREDEKRKLAKQL